MSPDFVSHKFNHDLLLDPVDQAAAREASCPAVSVLLDHEELRSYFAENDGPANAAKRRSRVAGTWAVSLAVISLFLASAGPLYHDAPVGIVYAIALLSAGLGLLSVVLGAARLLVWNSKREWLYRRFVTERLRQFHFQLFVCAASDIAEMSKARSKEQLFLGRRKQWFSAVKTRLRNQPAFEFESALKAQESDGVWLFERPSAAEDSPLADLPEDYFSAYRELRIRHQLQFAHGKIGNSSAIFFGSGLRRQEGLLSGVTFACILVLVSAHVVMIVSFCLGSYDLTEAWSHMIAIWSAILALAMRILEEGFQPKRELERYERYHAAVQSILERFEETNSRSVRYQVMVEMERLSFQEMCDFLRSGSEARFVM